MLLKPKQKRQVKTYRQGLKDILPGADNRDERNAKVKTLATDLRGLNAAMAPKSPAPEVPGAPKRKPVRTPKIRHRNESVQDRVAEITSQDSPLMRQAETKGLQFAQSRGLLNSSLAAQASEEAVISAARHIASQEASQAATSNQQKKDIGAQSGLQKRQIRADIKSRGLDRRLQRQIANWNLDSGDREAAAAMVTSFVSTHSARLQSILSNTQMPGKAKTRFIKSADAELRQAIDLAGEMYGVKVDFNLPSLPVPPKKPEKTTPKVAKTPKAKDGNTSPPSGGGSSSTGGPAPSSPSSTGPDGLPDSF